MHERREEVIQWVYEKYGRTRAAMVANFIRYRTRSAVRDVGKALGIPETSLARLAKMAGHYGGAVTPEMMRDAGLHIDDATHALLMTWASEIQKFPRHLSIHPGGFLLGHEPVPTLVPIENATMEKRTVIQWDKEDLEDVGLFKVDLLGLGALTQVDLALKLLKRHRGLDWTLADIPPEDPRTYAMARKADTVGVFQIESRAQMAMLPRLKPRTYYDLVIQVSIVRPGPITGGMVHPYLRRRDGLEEVDYPHPCLKPVLQKTLGIPIFQEQVMKIAVEAADYTPGEADQLRRDMAAWRLHGNIDRHHDRLVTRMIRKGITAEFAERIFKQIQGFGEYGFPESHAASFALIAYVTAYLRANYLPEFVCSLLNAQPMGFYGAATIVDDAKRHKLDVRPIDVTRSDWDCTLERAPAGNHPFALRMGLRYVKGMSEDEGRRIVDRRSERPFESVEDVARRTGLAKRDLERLAKAGALERLKNRRRDALWSVLRLRRRRGKTAARGSARARDRLRRACSFGDRRMGLRGRRPQSAPASPGTVRGRLKALGLLTAGEINALPHGASARYAGIVIVRQHPMTAKGVVFMTLEDETGLANLVLWPDVFARFHAVANTAGILGVTGKIQSADRVVHLIAQKLWRPELEMRRTNVKSRDFR
ncbi:MAG: hypothetical protein M5R36_18945 [Deltaproteobacteria bacterium]|nr:hypothetical protein [Deltaproteobacteria bacterium]